MKKRPVLAILLAFSLRLAAQLPAGAIAPDFNVQDINGQYWHLYDILADDKIVILEISATWCPPCWTYHNGHALQDLYTQHGPSGTDKLRVFFVEGDPNTNINCLYGQAGCNEYSPGDWVAGTPFPIIDNAGIADAYQISYYPTIYIICPNKKTYEVNQLDADDLWEKAQACPVAYGNNNAGLYDYSTGSDFREICTDLNVAPSFSLINLGSNPLTSANIDLHWNGSLVQTLEWTGNLPVYAEAPLSFDGLLLEEPGTLSATLSAVNTLSSDEDNSNNIRNNVFVMASEFSDQQILMKIKTDLYGNETYWALRDAAGNIIDQGGNPAVGPNGGGAFPGSPPSGPGTYSSNTVINEILNLPEPGCYSIQFVDAYGDGMCCDFGNGYYKLYNYDNPALVVLSGGVFETDDYRAFGSNLASVSTNEAFLSEIILDASPNPALDQVTISMLTTDEIDAVSAVVVNSYGQIVQLLPMPNGGTHNAQWQLETAAWPPGLYVVQCRIGGRMLTKKFVKQ